ncbi:MAG: hypothetical protein WC627_01345 [Legionella sp.]
MQNKIDELESYQSCVNLLNQIGKYKLVTKRVGIEGLPPDDKMAEYVKAMQQKIQNAETIDALRQLKQELQITLQGLAQQENSIVKAVKALNNGTFSSYSGATDKARAITTALMALPIESRSKVMTIETENMGVWQALITQRYTITDNLRSKKECKIINNNSAFKITGDKPDSLKLAEAAYSNQLKVNELMGQIESLRNTTASLAYSEIIKSKINAYCDEKEKKLTSISSSNETNLDDAKDVRVTLTQLQIELNRTEVNISHNGCKKALEDIKSLKLTKSLGFSQDITDIEMEKYIGKIELELANLFTSDEDVSEQLDKLQEQLTNTFEALKTQTGLVQKEIIRLNKSRGTDKAHKVYEALAGLTIEQRMTALEPRIENLALVQALADHRASWRSKCTAAVEIDSVSSEPKGFHFTGNKPAQSWINIISSPEYKSVHPSTTTDMKSGLPKDPDKGSAHYQHKGSRSV